MALDLPLEFGREVRAARLRMRRSQAKIAAAAGVSQPLISSMELGRGGSVSLDTWIAVAEAVGLRLELLGGDDGGALACHRMVAHLASRGGWAAAVTTDETILSRGADRTVMHVWDTVTAVGPDLARFVASIERERAAPGRVSGIVVIPAIGGNRRRVSEVREELRDVFPAGGNAWYAALVNAHRPMPSELGILWTFPDRQRLRPATVRPGWIWTAVGDAPRFVTGRRDRGPLPRLAVSPVVEALDLPDR